MIISKIIKGKNVAIKNPEKKVPCSVEDCPNYGRLGYYQAIGYTRYGNCAMRLVLFLCNRHQKHFEEYI